MRENVALFDSSEDEARDFIKGLSEQTGEKWVVLVCKSNKGRKGLYNLYRYFLYFFFPILVFFRRKKFKTIIAWQEFYGLIFAFYCSIFRVKKQNTLIIKNFIYKPKKGVIGKIYYRFMNRIVRSGYVDVFICASNTMVDYCCNAFEVDKDKFVFLPFGVNDFSKTIDCSIPPTNDYVLSIGRSNRDWDFLIDSFKTINRRLIIICDVLHRKELPPNITVLNDVCGEKSFHYIYNCAYMIIPIDNGKIASGDTVLLQAMSFSKPIIITKPSCLADDYVIDRFNGIIIEKKDNQLNKAILELDSNQDLTGRLSMNSRQLFLEKYSLYSYGLRVGEMIRNKGIA